ncbi:MAG: ribosome small subunit-dependent GTPase A [Chloroflexi bacterium]|nr:ribosome small subunit-dependent GTPase A [Chloroflexota bacterium]
MDRKEGLVVRVHGGHYYVKADQQIIDCAIRGRLKQEQVEGDLVAIGDRVLWSPIEEGRGVIEEVLPRKSVLSRLSPEARGQIEQVIVANPDQVLIVFSVRMPPLNPFMLDRYLVACEAANLPAAIVVNKIDLAEPADLELVERYRKIGYYVLPTSAVTGEGLEELRQLLRGKLTVLTGPSGVGKSTLLNLLWPDLDLPVGEISTYHERGKHTTVVPWLLNPEPDVYVADTPGLRQFRFWDIEPEQLDAFFPEMLPHLNKCRFTPCTHMHEPGCAVRMAVERGEISEQRYESYRRMFRHEV